MYNSNNLQSSEHIAVVTLIAELVAHLREEYGLGLNTLSRAPNMTSHTQFYFCQSLKYGMKKISFCKYILRRPLIKEKSHCLASKTPTFTWWDTEEYLITLLERQNFGRAAVSWDGCSLLWGTLFLSVISQDVIFNFHGNFLGILL